MYDKELALEILSRIYQATQTVLRRFEAIKSALVFPCREEFPVWDPQFS